jgi:hypothetical protein
MGMVFYSIIPALQRQRLEECKFSISLGYIAKPCLKKRNTKQKKKEKRKKNTAKREREKKEQNKGDKMLALHAKDTEFNYHQN